MLTTLIVLFCEAALSRAARSNLSVDVVYDQALNISCTCSVLEIAFFYHELGVLQRRVDIAWRRRTT